VINGENVFEKQVKHKTLNTLYELGLYDGEAPIILHGIVCRGDFSQVLIMVTNTRTEDFALADIGRFTFNVELFHSMPCDLTTSPCCNPTTVVTSSMK
jgi:hypothetical protein